jgi:hypothetical protein
MSFKNTVEAAVKSSRDTRLRRGRGFSRKEIEKANLSISEARRLGLIVDLRRKTFYEDNVEVLKAFADEMYQLLSVETKKPTSPKTKESSITELSVLKAVKESQAKLLVDAGISTMEDLAYCDIDRVAKKTGIDDDQILKMVDEALKKV